MNDDSIYYIKLHFSLIRHFLLMWCLKTALTWSSGDTPGEDDTTVKKHNSVIGLEYAI